MSDIPSATHNRIPLFIEHNRQGTYFTLPFDMPADTESFTLSYSYQRHDKSDHRVPGGTFTSSREVNIIDLGLIAPDGTQVGASGSDKLSIKISATWATPGYRPTPLVAGEWQIIVGAYKVAEAGVDVLYELAFTPKHLRLLKGDLHTHTQASDGVLSVEELAWHAQRNGLDFLAITDHNQMISTAALPQVPGITLIPGIEWTHYQGHANFLGVDQPYDEPFLANAPEEVAARFASARGRGAFISVNHPFDPVCPFLFDMHSLPYDCLEVWNGPMRGSNLQAIGFWHSQLVAGNKIPICGGSDYHRDSLLLFPGGPTTCVYASSAGSRDILEALKHGHAYLVYSANGPTLELTAGEAFMGDSVEFSRINKMVFKVSGLVSGDVVQVSTAKGSTALHQADTDGSLRGEYTMESPGFARIDVLRSFLPGLPLLPALISNPIYFDA
ncbi:MAG: hypothetical protein C3F13_02415 [Anaerolineales bacterium]|nr:MAG: hypothetical protein C3F13_02415 [Anaerolineales bacterium]